MKRSFKNFNEEILLDEARLMEWDFQGAVEGNEDEMILRIHDLENKIRNLVDRHAPIKVFEIDPNKINWITDDLIKKTSSAKLSQSSK